jgi:hypothetical protein
LTKLHERDILFFAHEKARSMVRINNTVRRYAGPFCVSNDGSLVSGSQLQLAFRHQRMIAPEGAFAGEGSTLKTE